MERIGHKVRTIVPKLPKGDIIFHVPSRKGSSEMTIPIPAGSTVEGFGPGRLRSLWDMINSQVFGLTGWLVILYANEENFSQRTRIRDDLWGQDCLIRACPDLQSRTRPNKLENCLNIAKLVQQFQLGFVRHRVERSKSR